MTRIAIALVLTITSATGLGWLLFGSDLPVVVDTAIARTRDDMKTTLGSEFRLDQAAQQLEQADGEIREQEARVAELRVSCRDLETEVTTLKQALVKTEKDFLSLDDAWQRSGEGVRAVSYRSRMTPPMVIGESLERSALKATSYKSRLDTRSQVLDNHTLALAKADQMLRQIRTRRDKVALTIENSRIDLESVRLLQASTGHDVNTSALVNAEEFALAVSKDLRVQREIVTVTGEADAGVSLAEIAPADAVQELRTRLRGEGDPPSRNEVAMTRRTASGFSP